MENRCSSCPAEECIVGCGHQLSSWRCSRSQHSSSPLSSGSSEECIVGCGHQLPSGRCSRSQHSSSSISPGASLSSFRARSSARRSERSSRSHATPPLCVHDPTPPYLSFVRGDMDTLSTCATYQEHIHSTYVTHRSQHIRHIGGQDRTIRTGQSGPDPDHSSQQRKPLKLRGRAAGCPIVSLTTLSPSPHTGSSLPSLPCPLIRLVL